MGHYYTTMEAKGLETVEFMKKRCLRALTTAVYINFQSATYKA